MKRRLSFFWKLLLPILGSFFLVFGYFFIGFPRFTKHQTYGVTWSKTFAEYLGINSLEGLTAVLDDLGIRQFRIPAYWSEVEPKEGKFEFDWLKNHLDEIAKRGGTAIVVVGAKQPRWPECWIPEWAKTLSVDKRQEAQTRYLRRVFVSISSHPALFAWQVENEPALSYGVCDGEITKFAQEEFRLMHSLERAAFPPDGRHPIYTTESGELSTWMRYRKNVDGLGVSIYRTVLTPSGEMLRYYFLPPWFYARHAFLIPDVKTIYVSEFQMEPWIQGKSIKEMTIEEQTRTFTVEQMKENFLYAKRVNLSPIHFWGAEWWYWLKIKKGYPTFWETARSALTH